MNSLCQRGGIWLPDDADGWGHCLTIPLKRFSICKPVSDVEIVSDGRVSSPTLLFLVVSGSADVIWFVFIFFKEMPVSSQRGYVRTLQVTLVSSVSDDGARLFLWKHHMKWRETLVVKLPILMTAFVLVHSFLWNIFFTVWWVSCGNTAQDKGNSTECLFNSFHTLVSTGGFHRVLYFRHNLCPMHGFKFV